MVQNSMCDDNRELLPVVDEQGNVVGAASRGECHDGSKPLHPVVHLHLFNSRGEIFLQLRPKWKTIQPGKWDTAVGGHVALGESIGDALRRETLEEIGLDVTDAVALPAYLFESRVERELVFPFKIVTDAEPKTSEELDGGRFWSLEEVRNNLGNGVFTPNFEQEFIRLNF